MSRVSLVLVERVLAAITVVVGWVVVVDQLVRDGWGEGGGTAWLMLFAVVASIGVVAVAVGRAPDAHALRAVGLVAVAVSPTVFAYPLNAVVLVFALIEVALLARAHGFGARRARAHSG